jgi:hypothetical protein
MRACVTLGLAGAWLLAVSVTGVGADEGYRAGRGHGHERMVSPLERHAENPGGRFDPALQAREIERRLRRPDRAPFYPYLPTPQDDSAALDAQIHRLGEAIRRERRTTP